MCLQCASRAAEPWATGGRPCDPAHCRRGELILREELPGAFASVEEDEEAGVGGAGGLMEAAKEEEAAATEEAEGLLGDDVWALMKARAMARGTRPPRTLTLTLTLTLTPTLALTLAP